MTLLTDNLHKAWNARYPTGIVSMRHRFIYFPVPKAASSSMKRLIAEFEGLPNAKNPHDLEFQVAMYKDLDKYEGFERFSVIRNPMDRLVSCYKDKVRGLVEIPLAGESNTLHHGFERYNRLIGVRLFHSDMSFEEFVGVVTKIPDSLADEHFRSQHRLFSSPLGKSLVDTLLRFESLEEDLEAYFAYLGVPTVSLARAQSTATSHDHEYYTDQLARKVRRRYRKDIEIFEQLQ